MRLDLQESTGLVPARPSASTQAQNFSSSHPGSLSLIKPGSNNTPAEIGAEIEVHNLLIIDQHTFEGTVFFFVFIRLTYSLFLIFQFKYFYFHTFQL